MTKRDPDDCWLEERPALSEGWAYKIRITEQLASIKTPYQQIGIFQSTKFGRVMTLDGVIQLTEYDEPHYHEMGTHVALIAHPHPRSVLVIGGGDGGMVREILKHPSIEEIHLCELDEQVVKVSLEYFPVMAAGLNDPKVLHAYEDGTQYIKKFKKKFDVIIVDSTDPEGPGEVLFQRPFFEDIKEALSPQGICVTQGETFLHPVEQDFILEMFTFLKNVFQYTGYFWAAVPTYPSGSMGFTFLSNNISPYETIPDENRIPKGLQYYSAKIHTASFALPEKFRRKLFGSDQKN